MDDRKEVKCVYLYMHVLAGTFCHFFQIQLEAASNDTLWLLWFLATNL